MNRLDLFELPTLDSNDTSNMDSGLLSSIKRAIDRSLEKIQSITTTLDRQHEKVSHPLFEGTEPETKSTSTIFSEGGGGIVKKLKLKLKPPTPSKADPAAEGKKTLPRVGYGIKNLARAKELSRLQSSTLHTSGTSVEIAKQRENQIPVNLFWSYLEPFFAALTENDLKFLKSADLDEALFIVPKHLHKTLRATASSSPVKFPSADLAEEPNSDAPVGSLNFQSEPNFKLLSMRVITLLVEENLINIEEGQELLRSSSSHSPLHQEDSPTDGPGQMDDNISLENIPDLQNRIMQELSFINLPKLEGMQSAAPSNVVDDTFRELKCLQYCLRTMHAVNSRRKEILASFVRARMASLEYYSILDELDKQIEHIYVKKYRVLKKKKRNIPVDIVTECPELEGLLVKRAALVKNFASIVMPRNQISIPLSNELLLDTEEEKKIASKFEIPTLSDEEARRLFGIDQMVEDSKISVWPTEHHLEASTSSESFENKNI